MRTIRLQVKDHAYSKVLEMLKQFDAEDVSLMPENDRKAGIKAEMEAELKKIADGTAKLMTLEEFDLHIDAVLKEYED